MNLSPAQIEELRGLLARRAGAPTTREEIERLNQLLASDAQAQQMFADYAMLDACLEMVWTNGEAREIDDPAFAESVAAEQSVPIILEASPSLHAPLSAFHSPLGGLLFSYSVAAVIVAAGMLIGWACQVSGPQPGQAEFVDKTPRPVAAPLRPESETIFVGRITGLVECRWADPRTAPVGFDRIGLGRKYRLVTGLVEISYDCGARVILQGPCIYEVESKTGGYLALGKVTARVEKKAGPPSAVPLPPSALFFVRTPTARVTDLGTEFGVEVDKSGASRAYVYQGKVELRAVDDNAPGGSVISLGKNESARVEAGKKRAISVVRDTGRPDTFVRNMPKRLRIKLSNTGVNLKDGEKDPHWQLAARSDERNMKPQPAVVSSAGGSMWLANQSDRSQWISVAGGDSMLPEHVVYTFRTKFDLTGMRPSTAILHGRFVVDNRVRAIRLNGHEVRVPAHGDEQFGFFHAFSIENGFVDGVNVLEFEVENGARQENVPSSPMGLLVELEGSVLSAWPAPSANIIDAKKK